MQAAYDANKSQLLVPRQYRLAQIYIKNPKDADPAATAKAEAKLDSVRKSLAKRNADFAAIATADSDDPNSATKGGNLDGWLPETRIQPEIRAQLGSLKKGAVSAPVRLDDRHILKVIEVKNLHSLPGRNSRSISRANARPAGTGKQPAIPRKTAWKRVIEINELSLSKVLKQP